MSLLVDKIVCVEESDENESDDIYLIVFRGLATAPFSTGFGVAGPGSAWSDLSTGETRNADVRIAGTSADSVYAMMIVEKDSDRDISGDDVIGAWKSQVDLTWKSVMLSFVSGNMPTNTEAAKTAGFDAIKNTLNGLASLYMNFPKGDDDVIAVKRVTIVSSGQSQTIRFRSGKEDATYDVTFRQVS
ncbi:hypothetical protein WME94_55965 [Sorangium sp. So ce429]